MSSLPKYVPPKKNHRPDRLLANGLPQSHDDVVRALKKFPDGATSKDISERTKYTRSHCGMILDKLHSKKMVTREKISLGQVRYYIYKLKEEENA